MTELDRPGGQRVGSRVLLVHPAVREVSAHRQLRPRSRWPDRRGHQRIPQGLARRWRSRPPQTARVRPARRSPSAGRTTGPPTRGVTYAGGAAPSHQSAQRYRLQVAQSATITDSNVIDDVTVDQTTYTAFTKTYPEGDLWWRVQAIDAKGNRLAWSDTRKLVKADPGRQPRPDHAGRRPPTGRPRRVPRVQQPRALGRVPVPVDGQDFDVTWKIEVYKNDDTTLSAGNRVLSTISKQAAFVPPASAAAVVASPTAGGSSATTRPAPSAGPLVGPGPVLGRPVARSPW